jgi:alkanesulfonate monooxygenase SsuD/methylene tetrahydromethanopterin reductase-like flavin-dependent oxidoreductase (luciferase family)
VLEAERLGFDSAWTSEAWGGDAVTTVSWLLARTTKIKGGTGIMQMQARTPACAAMTAMSLQALSGGRFAIQIARQIRHTGAAEHDRFGAIGGIRARIAGGRARLDVAATEPAKPRSVTSERAARGHTGTPARGRRVRGAKGSTEAMQRPAPPRGQD